MKKILFAVTLTLVTLAQVQDAAAQATASVTGAWDYSIDTPEGENSGTLTLADSSGVMSGAMAGDDGQTMPLSNIELVKDTLSFGFTTNGYGSGTGQFVFAGDTLRGHLNLPSYGRFPVRGTRQPAESAAAVDPEAAADGPVLSTRTPLRELFQNERAKAVVEKHVPGLTTDPEIDQAMGMTLREIAPYAPETFTEQVLEAIDADLADL